jgi:hypothetical protein
MNSKRRAAPRQCRDFAAPNREKQILNHKSFQRDLRRFRRNL